MSSPGRWSLASDMWPNPPFPLVPGAAHAGAQDRCGQAERQASSTHVPAEAGPICQLHPPGTAHWWGWEPQENPEARRWSALTPPISFLAFPL